MIPQTNPPTMTAAEAADLLGWSEKWFRRQASRLVREDDMPAALPGGRYSRLAFERWLEAYGARKAKAAGQTVAAVRISFDRNRLSAKYAGGAAA